MGRNPGRRSGNNRILDPKRGDVCRIGDKTQKNARGWGKVHKCFKRTFEFYSRIHLKCKNRIIILLSLFFSEESMLLNLRGAGCGKQKSDGSTLIVLQGKEGLQKK